MRALTLTIALSSALLLSACNLTFLSPDQRAALQDAKQSGALCDVLSPITYDGKFDTQPTKAQIKKYNAQRDAFCKTQGDKK